MGLVIFIFISIMILVILFNLIDLSKKRACTFLPKVSFIIPCHNDGDSIESTISSIYSSYPKDKFDITVIDDFSTDNTKDILKKLSKKYRFKTITNKVNLGKVLSINNAIKKTKHEFIFVVDADMTLNKKAIEDIFARFEYNPKVAAVSCIYTPKNKGFWQSVQQLDYNMQTVINGAYNTTSCVALWGGNMVIKRGPLMEVGLFSYNMLTEDLDMALKLSKAGYKVEQSYIEVETMVPGTFRDVIKQRKRWGTGAVQCMFRHTSVYLKNPISLVFLMSIVLFGSFFLLSMVKLLLSAINLYQFIYNADFFSNGILSTISQIYNQYDSNLWESIKMKLLYGTILTPAIFLEIIRKRSILKNILLFFVLVLVYYPIISIVYLIYTPKGIWLAMTKSKDKRGW